MFSDTGLCLAMWSGPRNISTAMMRAFENRGDCEVVDEPLYACYLAETGIEHPMREAIIAAGDTDWQPVVTRLAQAPGAGRLFYQKHITTHMLDAIDLDFLSALDHAFLIRDPVRVVASYQRKRSDTAIEDLGYVQMQRVFEEVTRRQPDSLPIVLDSAAFLEAPEAHLRALCKALGIPFDNAMLAWPAGPRDSDGIWATHWYDAVNRSTGFAAPPGALPTLDADQQALADACRPYYEMLRAHAERFRDAHGIHISSNL